MNLTENAPAKLNLTLDILGKRPDGYHEMQMVMQSISLADTVTVTTDTGTGGITVSTDRADLSGGPDNIAWRAADAFYRETGTVNSGTAIALRKRIPMQAGMAGGSADGAAVLRALRRQYAPDMPREELERIGALVGSDVPFCIRGGTVLAQGRGERLTDLPSMPACTVLVCKPDFGLSTPALFGRFRPGVCTGRPDNAAMQRALAAGDLTAAAAGLANVFETLLTAQEHETIREIETLMLANGALNAVMTGSGPTVFGLFAEEALARQAAAALRPVFRQTVLAHPVGPSV